MTEDYVAGLFEAFGGFYVFHHKSRSTLYPKFKLVCTGEEKVTLFEDVAYFLKKEYGIAVRFYTETGKIIFAINQLESLEKFLNFLEKNCNLPKSNQAYVKEVLKKHKEVTERRISKRKKTITTLKEKYSK